MFKKIEALGSGLLGLLVPTTEASAAVCYVRSWSSCWQCAYRPCSGCCDINGRNCQYIDCK
ncbi:hypothetical protein ACFTXM_02105 [Streptomyces sp. NPDC056930]|uniref:hypothetical protein n=1 Tax=unclassified Streptomyces TaxID=2593676 RepID=UPI00081EAFA4|nr:hypothetical protein [Streptomyces sp. Ncost-T10-10d]SCF83345.1 hypothetical protein GA0115254_118591 [Streptomyces sp. Ncost-T10-10d]